VKHRTSQVIHLPGPDELNCVTHATNQFVRADVLALEMPEGVKKDVGVGAREISNDGRALNSCRLDICSALAKDLRFGYFWKGLV
jgi:hypothetical protein